MFPATDRPPHAHRGPEQVERTDPCRNTSGGSGSGWPRR